MRALESDLHSTLFKNNLFSFYVHWYFAFMDVYVGVLDTLELESQTVSCKLTSDCWKLSLGPRGKPPMFLTPEPSL